MSILTPDTIAMSDIPHDVRADSLWAAWQLPPDERCAATARSLIRQALTAVRLPDDLLHVVMTVVSELATNAHVHVVRRHAAAADNAPGPPELWLHMIEHPEPRLVVAVFDIDRDRTPVSAQTATLTESGRGIQIVGALSSEWGCRPTRSRAGSWPLPGKAVWAAFALPPRSPRPGSAASRPTPFIAARVLHAELTARGIDRIYRNGNAGLQVISVGTDLTVWVADTFYWRDDNGHYQHRDIRDVADTAEQIIELHERLGLLRPGPGQL